MLEFDWVEVDEFNWRLSYKINDFQVLYKEGRWYVKDNGYLWPYSYRNANAAKEAVNGFID